MVIFIFSGGLNNTIIKKMKQVFEKIIKSWGIGEHWCAGNPLLIMVLVI
jgi:nicotinic acid phosphoribosyltransferase